MVLPSHLTDVVQPLDLSVFMPFKAALKKRQREGRNKNRGKSITPFCLRNLSPSLRCTVSLLVSP